MTDEEKDQIKKCKLHEKVISKHLNLIFTTLALFKNSIVSKCQCLKEQIFALKYSFRSLINPVLTKPFRS